MKQYIEPLTNSKCEPELNLNCIEKETYNEKTKKRNNIKPNDYTINTINKFCDPVEIFNKIKPIFSMLTKILYDNKKNLLYPNEKNAYHIFGADIMIDDNFIPKLIELNEAPGFSSRNIHVKKNLSQKMSKTFHLEI